MTYLGEIHNGVVVLKDAPQLEEGTRVRVEVESRVSSPRTGSPEAVLAHGGVWAGPEGEMDRLLSEVHQSKQDELTLQQGQPEAKL